MGIGLHKGIHMPAREENKYNQGTYSGRLSSANFKVQLDGDSEEYQTLPFRSPAQYMMEYPLECVATT